MFLNEPKNGGNHNSLGEGIKIQVAETLFRAQMVK
jgi:hypothetical protein